MLLRIAIFFTALLMANATFGQTFLVGQRSLTFVDASRANRSIPVEIFYPATTAGTNTPMAGSAGIRFPVIAFGHGFVMGVSAYQNIADGVVPAGFIIVMPSTESGLSPSHTEFAKDLAYLTTAMQTEGNNVNSFFYNRIDSTSCVMGHSMGGGASVLAMQYNSSISALANLAAAETNPSAIAAASQINVPALIIATSTDCVTPASSNQLPIYSDLQSSCKFFVNILGGSHCQFANYNFNCALGELTCTPSPVLSRAQQHAIINQLLVPWLKYVLKGDCMAGVDFESYANNSLDVATIQSCAVCAPTAVNDAIGASLIQVYLNSQSTLHLQSANGCGNARFSLFDLHGRLLLSREVGADPVDIDLKNDYKAGLYLWRFDSECESVAGKIVLQ